MWCTGERRGTRPNGIKKTHRYFKNKTENDARVTSKRCNFLFDSCITKTPLSALSALSIAQSRNLSSTRLRDEPKACLRARLLQLRLLNRSIAYISSSLMTSSSGSPVNKSGTSVGSSSSLNGSVLWPNKNNNNIKV